MLQGPLPPACDPPTGENRNGNAGNNTAVRTRHLNVSLVILRVMSRVDDMPVQNHIQDACHNIGGQHQQGNAEQCEDASNVNRLCAEWERLPSSLASWHSILLSLALEVDSSRRSALDVSNGCTQSPFRREFVENPLGIIVSRVFEHCACRAPFCQNEFRRIAASRLHIAHSPVLRYEDTRTKHLPAGIDRTRYGEHGSPSGGLHRSSVDDPVLLFPTQAPASHLRSSMVALAAAGILISSA